MQSLSLSLEWRHRMTGTNKCAYHGTVFWMPFWCSLMYKPIDALSTRIQLMSRLSQWFLPMGWFDHPKQCLPLGLWAERWSEEPREAKETKTKETRETKEAREARGTGITKETEETIQRQKKRTRNERNKRNERSERNERRGRNTRRERRARK